MKGPKLAIGYVTGGVVENEFMQGIYRFLEFDSRNRKVTLGLGFRKGLYVEDLRDSLVPDFLDTYADYFLSVDTDQDFDPEVPYVLLDDMEQNDRAIEGALYFGFLRGGKIKPVWFVEGSEPGSVAHLGKLTTGEVMPLAAIGMGCTIIRRDVFETIAKVPEYAAKYPIWFPRGAATMDGKPTHQGEDVGFCQRAAKCGYQTWGNATVQANHYKKMKIDFDLFRMFYEDAKRRGVEY